jgi:RNA polymerase sigma-70 factor (sigma-E family)
MPYSRRTRATWRASGSVIVCEVRAQDEEEFTALFVGRAPALRRTAYLLCGDWHLAEDLVQNAFSRVYAAWRRIRRPDSVEAYLRRTLVRAFIDDRRGSWSRQHPREELPEIESRAEPIDDRLYLLWALDQLPPRQRACLVLRFFEDYTVKATARALGCRQGTIKSQTARGLATLRRVLGPVELGVRPSVRQPETRFAEGER